MKKLAFTLLMSVTLFSLFGQNTIGLDYESFSAIKNYKLSNWSEMNFSLDFSSSAFNQKVKSSPRLENYQLNLSPSFNYYIENERNITNIKTNLTYTSQYSNSYSSVTYNNIRSALSIQEKYYILENVFLNSDVVFEILNSNRNEKISSYNSVVSGEFSFGLGYGKVRNVTPIVRAYRFKKRYDSLGTGDSLSGSELENLASVFAKYSGFRRTFDRYEKEMWKDANNTVNQKMNDLSPYETYFLGDIFKETMSNRYEGYDCSINFAGSRDFDKDNQKIDENETILGMNIHPRIYNNINHLYQISLESVIEIDFYQNNEDFDNIYKFMLNNGHLFSINDRIDYLCDLTYRYEKYNYDSNLDISMGYHIFDFDNSFIFYVEDNFSITASLRYNGLKRNYKIEDHTDKKSYSSTWDARVGFSYHWGSLN